MKITREMLWTSGWALLILAVLTKGGWLFLIIASLNFAAAIFKAED